MINNRYLSVLLAVFILIIANSLVLQSHAAEEKLSFKQMLLTPGDLTQAHAELETKCESCHVHFDKSNQTKLCIDCHELINDEINSTQGLHGKLSTKLSDNCSNCHTDHKGRDFNITSLDKDRFDHSVTDFILKGQHKTLSCSSCHNDEVSSDINTTTNLFPVDIGFRFKSFECRDCHQDPHEGELGDSCADCHTEDNWQDSKFDHSETEFPLKGQHNIIECEACHVNSKFEKLATQCQACHLSNDSHLGVFGKQCESCHTSKNWSNSFFQHLRDAGYSLLGKHQDLQCIDCHASEKNPQNTCIACHKADDVHQGGNGDECKDCHEQSDWTETNFSHDLTSTGFPLTGAHTSQSCDACHLPGALMETNGIIRNCIDCHRSEDPHLGELGSDCQTCHQTESWNASVRFNHDFSSFPLTGSHQNLVCESCHISSEFSKQETSCISCHKDDDVHVNSLGEQCDSCHNTTLWTQWEFEHSEQTQYDLTGSHTNLKCELCHNPTTSNPLNPGSDCIDCHKQDDVHHGRFGLECQQCHDTIKFEEIGF